jgi:hypothetical protein
MPFLFLLGPVATLIAGLVGKGLYDSGREKSLGEGKAEFSAKIHARRARPDEMEAGL